MGANLNLMSDRVQANTAGMTSSPQVDPGHSISAAATPSDILNGIGTEYGGLASLFGGGADAVVTALDVPTSSVRGRLGGLVPTLGSLVAPGPTVTPPNAIPTALDSVNDPGVVGPTVPGQVATNVAAGLGGYSSQAAGSIGVDVAGAVAKVRQVLGI